MGACTRLPQGSSFLRGGRVPLVMDPQSSPLPQEMTSRKPAVLRRPKGLVPLLLSPFVIALPPRKGAVFFLS